jgi:hypothetical protein
MDPFDATPPGGDSRRLDRLLVWAATAGALGCSVLIFVLSNAQPPEPVAEPADTALPAVASSTVTTTTSAEPTTTTTPPVTTATTVPAKTTTQPPRTTKRTTTTRSSTTTVRTTTPRCQVAAWQRDTAYGGGQVVSYGGRLWVSKWWNYNAVPGANAEGVWLPAREC